MNKFYPSQKKLLSILFLLGFIVNTSLAQPVIGFGTPVVTGLNNPVDVVNAGGNRMFIAQQNGVIRVWDGTTTSTFMDLSGLGLFPNPLGGEQGLLSIAFHPGFATNRYFFLWYTGSTGAVTLARYRANVGNLTGDASSGVVLLSIAKPNQPNYYTNHNGGKLNFGSDGMLYIGIGDGGSGGDPFANAQNGTSLLGKMLRLNVNSFATSAPFYDIPADNPYLAAGDGIADEIYNIGLRNPWRWSFDRANGNMWIADVGHYLYEEINYRTAATAAGTNYGWRCREGMHNYNTSGCTGTYTDPIFEYPHNNATGGFSISGGYVYRGPDAANAALVGTYVCADFVSGNFWLVQPDGTATRQSGLPGSVVGFGEANDGTLYVLRRLGSPNGALYKVLVTAVLPVTIANFSGAAFNGYNQLSWRTSTENNTDKFLVQYSTDNVNFETVGTVEATGNATGSNYTFKHNVDMTGTGFYKLSIVENNGSFKYSSTLRLAANTGEKIKIYPTAITNNQFILDLNVAASKLQLISMDGKVVFEKNLKNMMGTNTVVIPVLSKGIYAVQIIADGYIKRERIIIQ